MDIDFTKGAFANVETTKAELTSDQVLENCEAFAKYLADLKPRALASFPEVAVLPLLKPIDWKRLTEKKDWPLFKYKTPSFDFHFGGEEWPKLDDKKLREDIAKRMSSIWSKGSFISEIPGPLPTKVEKKAPPDAVPIAGGVSLRPLKYEIDRIEILRKGTQANGGYWGDYTVGQSEVRVHFITADRVDGTELKLYYRQALKDELLEKDPNYLPAMIRQTMRAAYMHEVDEMLYLDGDRFTEPHPENAWMPMTAGAINRARADQRRHRETIDQIEQGKT